jgi:CRISPR/Cas system-associated exonuclease Cas4 (RecB family)
MSHSARGCRRCGVDTLRLSWSSLRNYVECKQKSKLMRSGYRPSLQDQRNFLPGTISDRIVRDWLKDEQRSPGGMLEMLDEYFLRSVAEAEESGVIKWKSVDDQQKVKDDCREALINVEPYLEKMVIPFEHWEDFKFEAPLHAARNGGGEPIHVTLNGYMDILVRDSLGQFFVFDLKQTRNNDYWRKTAGQMVYYSVATELIFGTKVTGAALLQPLATPRLKPIDITQQARVDLFRNITSMANDIENDEMPPKRDNDGCAWCDVRHACEKFKRKPGGRISLGTPTTL